MTATTNRIVILDDDAEFLDELKETLSLSGYDVTAAADTDGFQDIVFRTKPSLILLDLRMPKKTGFQIAHELKEYTQANSVPVIAMSAFMKDEYASFMQSCGIRTCLKKPFNPLDVITEIEKALERADVEIKRKGNKI